MKTSSLLLLKTFLVNANLITLLPIAACFIVYLKYQVLIETHLYQALKPN